MSRRGGLEIERIEREREGGKGVLMTDLAVAICKYGIGTGQRIKVKVYIGRWHLVRR